MRCGRAQSKLACLVVHATVSFVVALEDDACDDLS